MNEARDNAREPVGQDMRVCMLAAVGIFVLACVFTASIHLYCCGDGSLPSPRRDEVRREQGGFRAAITCPAAFTAFSCGAGRRG